MKYIAEITGTFKKRVELEIEAESECIAWQLAMDDALDYNFWRELAPELEPYIWDAEVARLEDDKTREERLKKEKEWREKLGKESDDFPF